jgi:hypothetical protein
MNLYQRVASANPKGAKGVINQFGYEVRTNNLPQALKMLVSAEGEPALRAIVDIHPDKDLILECYAEDKSAIKKDDNASSSRNNNELYFNAVGQQMTEAQKSTQLTNTFLIASTFIILTALILKN